MSNRIFTLQEEIVARLLAGSFFSTNNLEVLSLKRKDKLSELQKRINALTVGLAVYIPEWTLDGERRGIHFKEIKIQVGVAENRIANDSEVNAEDIVEAVCARLTLTDEADEDSAPWIPTCSLSGVPLEYDNPTVVEIPPDRPEDINKRILGVQFKLSGDITVSE
jgi:hypothetical protein